MTAYRSFTSAASHHRGHMVALHFYHAVFGRAARPAGGFSTVRI